MRLTVNGETVDCRAGTVRELLDELGVKARAVAVEVNLSIVGKKDFETFPLKEGDHVEIVNFVGGG